MRLARWFLAGVLAALPVAASAAPPASVEAVLMLADGEVLCLTLTEPPSAELLATVDAAWLWTPAVPPVRVAGDEVADHFAALLDAAPSREQLAVRLPASESARERTRFAVVAAPVRMWREVPEGWLPSYLPPAEGALPLPRDRSLAWRLRLVGEGRGTGWLDVAPGVDEVAIVPVDAVDAAVTVTDSEGRPLVGAMLTVLENPRTAAKPALLSKHRADEHGRLLLPALPADLDLAFLAGHPQAAPRSLLARVGDLPAELRLPAAVRVVGRFVDADGVPIGEVEVRADGWIDDAAPARFTGDATSDESGGWSLGPLPPRPMMIAARGDGLAPFRRRVEPQAGEVVDLGTITLIPGGVLTVAVRDQANEPIAGAEVSVTGGLPVVPATSDETGAARLRDLPASGLLEIAVSAEGFLSRQQRAAHPWPESVTVVLPRAFTVTGSFLDPDRRPLTTGSVRVVRQRDDYFHYQPLTAGGHFELALEPGESYALELTSPATRRLRVPLEPGTAGERRDLGDLVAPAGLTVTGSLVSAQDGLPVAGAHLWAPRPADAGAVVSWVHRDLVAARSDEAGAFELSGLAAKPELLRVDAPGFARLHVDVQPEQGVWRLDVGQLEMAPGATVRVVARGVDEEASVFAHLDLRGEWLDFDRLSAPVFEGEAAIRHAPAGRSAVEVAVGDRVLCETTVEVPAEGEVVATCDARNRRVAGVVEVGERRAGQGLLTWSRGGGERGGPGLILNRRSPNGLRQQQTWGGGDRPMVVDVGADGTFETDRLSAGGWSVVWQPSGGAPSAPQAVELPAGEVPELALRFEGGVLVGTVVDGEGLPVEAARVEDVDRGTLALTAVDGSFRLGTGVGGEGGVVRVQARHAGLYSDLGEVAVEAGRQPDPVRLVLDESAGGQLSLQAWTAGGAPAADAFVFVEAEGRPAQVVSADAAGHAELSFGAPYPTQVRAAVFHDGVWGLRDWQSWDAARRGVELTLGGSGELVVECDASRGPVTLVDAAGWDVSRLLTLLGARPMAAPERPLSIDGLPPGVYRLSFAGSERTVSLSPGRREAVAFE